MLTVSSVIMVNFVILNVIMLSGAFCIVMLSVIMLNFVMLCVVAPCKEQIKNIYEICHYEIRQCAHLVRQKV